MAEIEFNNNVFTLDGQHLGNLIESPTHNCQLNQFDNIEKVFNFNEKFTDEEKQGLFLSVFYKIYQCSKKPLTMIIVPVYVYNSIFKSLVNINGLVRCNIDLNANIKLLIINTYIIYSSKGILDYVEKKY